MVKGGRVSHQSVLNSRPYQSVHHSNFHVSSWSSHGEMTSPWCTSGHDTPFHPMNLSRFSGKQPNAKLGFPNIPFPQAKC